MPIYIYIYGRMGEEGVEECGRECGMCIKF